MRLANYWTSGIINTRMSQCGVHVQNVKLAKACVDANLTGFPAWIIGDKRLDGEQTMEKLESELAEVQKSTPQTSQ